MCRPFARLFALPLSFFHILTFAVSPIRQFVASPRRELQPDRAGGVHPPVGGKCEFPSQNPFSRVKCGIRGMRRQNIWRGRRRGLISGSVDGIGGGEVRGRWCGWVSYSTPPQKHKKLHSVIRKNRTLRELCLHPSCLETGKRWIIYSLNPFYS